MIWFYTQQDPIGIAGGLNLYGFAGGDPVNFSDPFGLCPDEQRENTICVAFFIQAETAGPLKGDGRTFSNSSDPEQSRGFIVVDVEKQAIVDRGFSGTCTAGGAICNDPSVLSQIGASFGPDGSVHVSAIGHNSISLVPAFSGYLVFTPDGNGGFSADGFATRFPSIEAYYFDANGKSHTLIRQPETRPSCLAFCGVQRIGGRE